MAILNEENFAELIANREDQRRLLVQRIKPYIERKVRKKEFSEPDEGWYVIDDELKHAVKLAKDKPHDEVFEDRVWALMSRLGFKYLSADRHCAIYYDPKGAGSQQIDVLAVDDECALIIECKSAGDGAPKTPNFKTMIESLEGRKAGLHRELRERFGKSDLKIGYILATENYIIREADKSRLESFKIHHLSDNDFEYYDELVSHLGTAARYQFEADIFSNQTIPHIDGRVYAVEGGMGKLDYFAFLIEPQKLLKLGYVLHRSKSIRLLPTYQRLIKKNRLSQIQKFINNGGYFPNSLVVSVDSGGKRIKFEPSAPSIEGALSRSGVLHLPNRYRSIYIIDGQHRLYGYSDTEYSNTNVVPVVAFIDLKRGDQLRLFMEINENQKAVSKNLKHTLDADLKWDSDNLHERGEGIKKQLAQELGEDTASPLYRRVLVGEDVRTDIKVITLEAILKGLNQTPFVGKFTKDSVKEQGLLNTGQSLSTLNLAKKVIIGCLDHVKDTLDGEWERLPRESALLTINPGITALIALIGDIVLHMVQRDEIRPLKDSPGDITEKAGTYLDGLRPYFQKLKDPDRAELRTKYGSGAPTRLRRIFQKAVHESRSDFRPDGMEEYWRDQSKQYNIDTYARIADIETTLRDEVKEVLASEYGPMWLKKGLSENLYTELHTRAVRKNRTILNEGEEKSPWDCLDLIHIREIVMYGNQWTTLFQKRFTIPGQENLRKADRTKWIVTLGTIRNNADHEYSVSKEQADYVAALHDWLIYDSPEAIKSINEGGNPADDGEAAEPEPSEPEAAP